MKCIICNEELPDNLTRRDEKGATSYIDENNLIRHRHLSPERAKEIGSGKNLSKPKRERAAKLGDALIDVVVDADDPRAPALKILLGELAKAASKDSASAIKAIETSLSLVGSGEKMQKPRKGEACQLCGHREADPMKLKQSSIEHLMKILAK